MPVTVAAVKVQDVPVYLDGIGTVQAFNTVQIKAQVNGTLLDLPVLEGQEAQKGEIVAQIDPAPYKAALDQALAQRAKDTAQLRSAQLNLQRYQALAKNSFAPLQQVDNQQALVDTDIASIQADDAMIETARINLGYCTIRAPFAGRVSLYQVDAGNLDPGRRPDEHPFHRPGQTHRRGLHPAGRRAAASAGWQKQSQPPGSGFRRRDTETVVHGHAHGAKQCHRHDDGNHLLEGALCE